MAEEKNIEKFKPVSIQSLMAEKNPRLAKIIPGLVYRFIHRVMYLDFFNGFMEKYQDLNGIEFTNAAVSDFEVTREIYGEENIPKEGSYIFVCNHPLGGFDSLLLMETVERHLGKFKFLVNDVLMKIPSLRPSFVPINKHGGNSRDAALLLGKTYSSGEQILIFPSGAASRRRRGIVADLPWSKHFITKSIQYKRDVVPVFISGRNSNLFYNIANIRTFMHISWNLEMFLLPSETFHHRKKTIRLYFGEPIPWTTFDNSKTKVDWAEYVRNIAYRLPEKFDKKE